MRKEKEEERLARSGPLQRAASLAVCCIASPISFGVESIFFFIIHPRSVRKQAVV
jgi:hypothetical protein